MSDLVVLTTVPVVALTQPLFDFLAAHGITAYSVEDDTGLDASQRVEVRVSAADEPKARELLEAFWAENEGPRDEM
jgi:hypothetical protein